MKRPAARLVVIRFRTGGRKPVYRALGAYLVAGVSIYKCATNLSRLLQVGRVSVQVHQHVSTIPRQLAAGVLQSYGFTEIITLDLG